MRVIKLGGSLMQGPWLRPWLNAACCTPGAVIVPGGGLFADAVRQAQEFWEFHETVAHRMALLAMDQFGLMLAAMDERLGLVSKAAMIPQLIDQGRVPVWLPSTELADGHSDIQETWDFTSDSLSLWLAATLGADELILVKSADLPGGSSPCIRQLADTGIVDGRFPDLLERFPMALRVLGPDHLPEPETPL